MARIAVVTPYCTEDAATLRRAHDSVLTQTVSCTHVLVADGHPKAELASWNCRHVVLPALRSGSFSRGVGALFALQAGADYVAFLDADNWYEPDHLESLLELARQARTAVTTSARCLRRPDGSVLAAHDDASNGDSFADTNTLFIHRDAFDLLTVWALIPNDVKRGTDNIFWLAVKARRYATAHTGRPTVNYLTRYRGEYVKRGEAPPEGALTLAPYLEAQRNWFAYDEAFRHRLVQGCRHRELAQSGAESLSSKRPV